MSLRSFVDIWRTSPQLSPLIISSVCNDAVALINQMSDHDILNTDVRLDNILVRLASFCGSQPKIEDLSPNPCVLIDLAQCRLWREGEDEDAWIAAKWSHNEEGASPTSSICPQALDNISNTRVTSSGPFGRNGGPSSRPNDLCLMHPIAVQHRLPWWISRCRASGSTASQGPRVQW